MRSALTSGEGLCDLGYEGDLSDIVGSSGTEWQPFPSNNPISYPSSDSVDDFGDPFTQFGDPLLHDIDTPSGFFHNAQGGVENIISSVVDSINQLDQHKNNVADEMRSSSIFSRMLQISPKLQVPPRELNGPSMLLPNNNTINDRAALISPNSSKIGLPTAAGVQISSPRNTGIKRRKSQAKKVVCIPAPAPAANSSSGTKPSGEVVPSDLWAWRKYGQKPIKGSPYPRGYYRCSSSTSKGCLARKQVERSRTDPNMLVITYTSEHNHPWPTQRNALAGSTRSHHPTSAAKDHSQKQLIIINVPPDHKQEHNKDTCSIENPTSTAADHHVKQELLLMDQHFDNNDAHEFEQGSSLFLESCEDSFFAELGEIEADVPLDLLTFPLGSAGEENNNSKALDPFSFYDWPGTNTTTSHADAAKTDSS